MTGRLPDGSYDFTGQQRQGGSTVYDYGPRMYNTSLGRPSAWLRTGFLEPDPVVPTPGNPQALNRYEAARPERSRRVLDNPLRYTDPTGMMWMDAERGGYTPVMPPALSDQLPENFAQEMLAQYSVAGLGAAPYTGESSTGITILLLGWQHVGAIDPFFGALVVPAKPGALTGPAAAEVEESAASIVQRTAREQAGRGREFPKGFMKPAERNAYERSPARGSHFLGQAAHRATFESLESQFPNRFNYSTRGPDFLDTWSGQRIELTTPGQAAEHAARYNNASIVTYTLPPYMPPPWMR